MPASTGGGFWDEPSTEASNAMPASFGDPSLPASFDDPLLPTSFDDASLAAEALLAE
jgi:hypothetical protein